MCLYPKLIPNRKYISNTKNGGNVPIPTDKRLLLVPVGCQKCMECKKQKGREWSIRLQEEIRTNKTGEFVTLTFSNESIKKLAEEIPELKGYDLDNAIAKLAVRRFLERWRKKYGISVKHWLVTELGHTNTEHIHLHGIIFLNKYKHNLTGIKEQYLREQKQDLTKIWQYGYVYIGDYVNEATVNYCVKYSTKMDLQHKEYNAKILTSPGIGKNYINRLDAQINKFKEKGETDETYKTRTGQKMSLPIYWRNNIYSEEQREKLWLQKLDKQERWVDGSRVSIKHDTKEYLKLLNQARQKNKRLGYGDDQKNWNLIYYENQQRQLKIEARIKNTKENLEPNIEEHIFGFKKYKRPSTT